MARRLARNVHMDDKWYGPAYGTAVPPPDIAAKITNPSAWEAEDAEPAERPEATIGRSAVAEGGNRADDEDSVQAQRRPRRR